MFLTLQGPNGEPIPAHGDASGNLLISPATTATVALQPWTAVNSTAYEAARILKASPGTLRSCFIQLDPTLASGTYYAQLIRDTAVPPDGPGPLSFQRPPFAIRHVNGDPTQFVFDEGEAGLAFGTGCVVCVSSTQFTKTAVANAALFAGSIL